MRKKFKGDTVIQGEDRRHRICTVGSPNGSTGAVNEKNDGKKIAHKHQGSGALKSRETLLKTKNMGFGGVRAGRGQTKGISQGKSK